MDNQKYPRPKFINTNKSKIMNQEQIDKIHNLVNKTGIINTIYIFGGNKDIIKDAYINKPEAYLDYLIGNLNPTKESHGLTRWVYMYKQIILSYDDYSNDSYIDNFIRDFFYKGTLHFNDDKIAKLFTSWLYKHHPKLSERKPKVYTSFCNIDMKLKDVERRLNRNV